MYGLLIALLLIDAIVLIALVLLQSGKSAGLSGAISGEQSNYLESKRQEELMRCSIGQQSLQEHSSSSSHSC